VDIATLRDLIIIIFGIVGVILVVVLFILFIAFYRKGMRIIDKLEETTTEAREVIGAVKEEFVHPVSKMLVIFQAIKQTASLVSEFVNKQQEGSHE
jgi:hypothetical protein